MYKVIGKVATILLLACMLTSCYEVDMSISMDGKNPPTFNLSGSGNLNFFIVMEVPPENQTQTVQRSSDKNIILWKIEPNQGDDSIKSLSAITYGRVPPKFTQIIPSQSESPPSLIEGKIYEVGGTAYNANGGFIWVALRDGKVVEVPKPDSK